MLFGNYKNYDVVTESYVGRTPTLKKAEKELQKVIEIINTFDNVSFETAKMVNYTAPCKKFNSLLSEEFGTTILVNFTPKDRIGAGAYTPVTSTIFGFTSTAIEYEKTGKLKSHNRVLPIFVTISYSVINEYRLTSDELMGIILHEIGHNIHHIPIINTLNIPILLLRPLLGAAMGEVDRIVSVVEGVPIINQGVRFINIINKFFKDITGDRLNFVKLFVKIMNGATLLIVIDPLRHFVGYLGERYSDSVATAYGYGEGLANGLLKIHNTTAPSTYNKVVYSNKITAFGDVFLLAFVDICMMITLRSVHPAVGHRIKNSLNKLERDLAEGDYPPQVKAELKQDIKTLRKTYEDYLNAEDRQKNEMAIFYRKYFERYGLNPLRNLALDKVYASLEV